VSAAFGARYRQMLDVVLGQGGRKIAEAIARMLRERDFSSGRSTVYT